MDFDPLAPSLFSFSFVGAAGALTVGAGTGGG